MDFVTAKDSVVRRGGQVRFIKTSRVLADLGGGKADDLYELISERAPGARPLVLTANTGPGRLARPVPQPSGRYSTG